MTSENNTIDDAKKMLASGDFSGMLELCANDAAYQKEDAWLAGLAATRMGLQKMAAYYFDLAGRSPDTNDLQNLWSIPDAPYVEKSQKVLQESFILDKKIWQSLSKR